jgi:hypothetical protein
MQPSLHRIPGKKPKRYVPEGWQNVGLKVVVIEKTGG